MQLTFRDNIIGIYSFKNCHVLAVSPVQIAEYLFYPAKKDLDSMNGLVFLSSFFSTKPL
jgi:hypothetical protein